MVQPSESTAGAFTGLDWRRPHPITILVEIGNALRSIVVAIVVVRGGFLGASSLLELAVITTPLAAALARWYTTRYALDTESVFHQYGLIRRRKQVLPRANIQNVSTKAGIIARMGSVVELQISDASSSGDINLRLVSREEADRITTLLRSSMTHDDPDPSADAPSSAGPASTAIEDQASAPLGLPVDRPPLVSPSMTDLLRAEVTSMPTITLAVVSVCGIVAAVAFLWVQPVEIPSNRLPILLVAIAGLAPLALAAVSMASRLLVLGGYRLYGEPDRLRIQAGLLTEARVAARRERLQQIQVLRELPHQWMGLERVKYETADVELNVTGATSYLSPIGKRDGWKALAVEALGELQVDESALKSVSPLTKRRMWVRFVVVAPVLILVTALAHPLLAVASALAWLAFGWWYGLRRFDELGWATSDDQYLVRTGVIHNRLILVRLDKIQSLRMTSTVFQRRLGLATVHVSTAGRGLVDLVSLPDLPSETAEDLLAALALRAARTPIAETL